MPVSCTASSHAPELVSFAETITEPSGSVNFSAFEVGAVNFAVWERELRDGRIDPEKVRVIWRTPTYPDYQWSIRGDVQAAFGPDFIDRVRTALLELDDPDLLASFPRSGFIPAANSDYAPIEKVGKEIGILD
jgi:phosphonate transport system substrate-binding protein